MFREIYAALDLGDYHRAEVKHVTVLSKGKLVIWTGWPNRHDEEDEFVSFIHFKDPEHAAWTRLL